MGKEVKKIPNEIVVTVGNNIKAIIKEKGYKTRIIAEKADMDVETLRKYINAKMEMGITRAYKISQALDIDISELFKIP